MSGTLRGTLAHWTPSWMTAPPVIKATTQQEVELIIAQMAQTLTLYEGTPLATKDGNDDDLPDADIRGAWNGRFNDARRLFRLIRSGSSHNYVYQLFGVPVGIVCLAGDDYVADIVTLPSVEGAGGILMEVAATHSQQNGCNGKLQLYSLTDQSTLAYRAWGFTKDDGQDTGSGNMTLDPQASELWVLVGSRWRLAKYQNTNYYAARYTKPLPLPPGRNNGQTN